MIINTNKRDNNVQPSLSVNENDQLKQIQDEIDKLCAELSVKSTDFSPSDFFLKLYNYIRIHERFLYVNITNYICILDDNQFATVQTNIDTVAHYIYSQEFQNNSTQFDSEESYEKSQRAVLKLWDHVNLARRQFQLFLDKDENYRKIAEEKAKEVIPELTKDMNSQLIALVSIFTALSFLLFGGISSLDNILDGAKDIPILKLLITGNIWCLCIMNLIFVFMFFISKLTKLEIKSTDDVNANFIQKYPFIWWCNWVLISSGLVFGWLYYLKRRQLLCDIEESLFKNPVPFIIIVSLSLLILILLSGIYILSNNGKAKDKH